MKERVNFRGFGLVILICLLFLFPTSAWAAVYYVDINNGSDTIYDGTSPVAGGPTGPGPWKTLHYAIEESSFSNGDVLNVAGGTYSVANGEDDSYLTVSQSNVTIQGGVGGTSILEGPDWSTGEFWNAGLEIVDASNVTLKDLVVQGFYYSGILITSGTGSIIEGCEIYDNNDGIRIVVPSSGNIIRNNCEIYNNDTGIGIDGSSGNEIYGNQIYDNGAGETGIHIEMDYYEDDPVHPEDNLVHDNNIYWSGDGDYPQYTGVRFDDAGPGNQVYQNRIHGHADFGIYMDAASPEIRKNQIYDNETGIKVASFFAGIASPSIVNNLIYDTGAGASTMSEGIFVSTSSGTSSPKIYHNTIDGVNSSTGSFGLNIGFDTTPDIKGNIITNFNEYGIYNDGNPSIDYNDVWNMLAVANYNNDIDEGPNDIQANPRYASYQLQSNSPCIDAIPLGQSDGDPITDDIEGNPRPQGSGYDMGAYEYTVSITETVPIPPGIEIEDYVMISFTVEPGNPACTAVFGPEMGGIYDEDNFRIGAYDPTINGYVDCGGGLVIEPGRAYWVLARNGVELTVEGPPASLGDTEVPLLYNSNGNGWHQIGCPNAADYAWGDVQVLENGAVIGAISDLPSDNEWIDKRLWCWENGSYDPNNDFMEQGEGYWVRVKKANVSLKFLQSTQVAQLSNSSIMFAGLFNKAKRWMKEWVFSPKTAIASSNDSPPMPMGVLGASESPSADTASEGDGGGGCFVDSLQ